MKPFLHLLHASAALFLAAAAATANPIVWTLTDVVLSDGATVSGTFTFDPEAGTPCGSFSPCGKYTDVDIVTTNGPSRTGATYSFACGQDVAACTGVTADSTEVLLLASNASNQAGSAAIAFFFTGVGVFPPQGLNDAGGSIDVSGALGVINEANCSNAACTMPSNPSRSSIAGFVTAPTQPINGSPAPEPATALLFAGGLAATTIFVRFRNSTR